MQYELACLLPPSPMHTFPRPWPSRGSLKQAIIVWRTTTVELLCFHFSRGGLSLSCQTDSNVAQQPNQPVEGGDAGGMESTEQTHWRPNRDYSS